MSNELESDKAMVTNFEIMGSMVLVTMRPRPSRHKPAVKIIMMFMFQVQVTQIVRFLLERGLRFRNLGFCGHDLM